MKFYYVETALLPLWQRLNSLCFRSPLPPSQQVFMPMAEFVSRMQTDCKLSHCVYPEDGEEFYYMQTQLARGMLGDVDLYSPPLSCLGKPGQAGNASSLCMAVQFVIFTFPSRPPVYLIRHLAYKISHLKCCNPEVQVYLGIEAKQQQQKLASMALVKSVTVGIWQTHE